MTVYHVEKFLNDVSLLNMDGEILTAPKLRSLIRFESILDLNLKIQKLNGNCPCSHEVVLSVTQSDLRVSPVETGESIILTIRAGEWSLTSPLLVTVKPWRKS